MNTVDTLTKVCDILVLPYERGYVQFGYDASIEKEIKILREMIE